jgi:mannose-6-phosphate isomerase-like protein (cupin superfamily)
MLKKGVLFAILVGALCSGGPIQAQDNLSQSSLDWREMFPGVSFAPAYGDWEREKHGKFVRIIPGTEIPMHTHSNGYRAVIISGRMANLHLGGERAELAPGDYFFMASGRPHAHECLSEEPCFFYTYGDEPWDIAIHNLRE